MRKLKVEASRPRHFATHVLAEYIKCAIHLTLWASSIYPLETFSLKPAFATSYWRSKSIGLCRYIDEVVESLRGPLHAGCLRGVDITFLGSASVDAPITVEGVYIDVVEAREKELDSIELINQYDESCRASLDNLRRRLPLDLSGGEGRREKWIVRTHMATALTPALYASDRLTDNDKAKGEAAELNTTPSLLQRFLCSWIGMQTQSTLEDAHTLSTPIAYLRLPLASKGGASNLQVAASVTHYRLINAGQPSESSEAMADEP